MDRDLFTVFGSFGLSIPDLTSVVLFSSISPDIVPTVTIVSKNDGPHTQTQVNSSRISQRWAYLCLPVSTDLVYSIPSGKLI